MTPPPRRGARRLRGVFRRSALGIGHRGPVPPLVFRAGDGRLRAQHRYQSLAGEPVESGPRPPPDAVALPLDPVAAFEGRDDSPVTLEAASPGRTVVRW